jgi:DNA-binding transcriptional LysR family regulator
MNLQQLRCFVLAAEELHFGRAAQQADMQPSALGRSIRLLEEDLGVRLFHRTTRSIILTQDGARLLGDAHRLLAEADAIRTRFQEDSRRTNTSIRVGAIDSAALGLIPSLLNDFRQIRPDVEVELIEEKTIRLLPKLVSGRADVAFLRPPIHLPTTVNFCHLLYETPIVAVPSTHPLAKRKNLSMNDIVNEPLIVPDRRSRPHSHDVTIKLFQKLGRVPSIAQVATEKQTIVHVVSTGLGLALVPRWISGMSLTGVTYLPLILKEEDTTGRLPLAAAWMAGSRDSTRDSLMQLVYDNIDRYASRA